MRKFHQQLFNSSPVVAVGVTTGSLSGSNGASGSLKSRGVPILSMEGFSVHAVFKQSGSLPPLGVTGSFTLEASNERMNLQAQDPCAGIIDWVPIPGTTQVLSASTTSTQFLWNISSAYYAAFRVNINNIVGTGSLDCNVTGKGPVAG